MSTNPVLVTGGAGFIGRHLVRHLAARGHPVRVLDPDINGTGFGTGVEAVAGSVLDRETVARLMKNAGQVYHLAAITQLWMPDKSSFQSVNTEGTRMVLDEAARAGVGRIVVTSTEIILRGWRNTSARPITEAEPTPRLEDMAGDYCRSKYLADRLARDAARDGLPVVITYPTVPVGPGDHNLTASTQMIVDLIQRRAAGISRWHDQSGAGRGPRPRSHSGGRERATRRPVHSGARGHAGPGPDGHGRGYRRLPCAGVADPVLGSGSRRGDYGTRSRHGDPAATAGAARRCSAGQAPAPDRQFEGEARARLAARTRRRGRGADGRMADPAWTRGASRRPGQQDAIGPMRNAGDRRRSGKRRRIPGGSEKTPCLRRTPHPDSLRPSAIRSGTCQTTARR